MHRSETGIGLRANGQNNEEAKVKNTLLAAIAVASLATAAAAGSPEPHIAYLYPGLPGSDANWGGFYLGGVGGVHSGTADPNRPDFDATSLGAFAGFNHQRDQLVVGVEIAAQAGDLENTLGSFDIDHLLDAKAHVGYSVGDALLFVSGGFSAFSSGMTAMTGIDATGWNAGGGVDYAVSEMFFLGGEYTYRALSDTASTGLEIALHGLQLRAGARF